MGLWDGEAVVHTWNASSSTVRRLVVPSALWARQGHLGCTGPRGRSPCSRDGYYATRYPGWTEVCASVTRWWVPVRGPHIQSAYTIPPLHVSDEPAKQLGVARTALWLLTMETAKKNNKEEIRGRCRGGDNIPATPLSSYFLYCHYRYYLLFPSPASPSPPCMFSVAQSSSLSSFDSDLFLNKVELVRLRWNNKTPSCLPFCCQVAQSREIKKNIRTSIPSRRPGQTTWHRRPPYHPRNKRRRLRRRKKRKALSTCCSPFCLPPIPSL